MTTNPRNSYIGLQRFYRHRCYTKNVRLLSKFPEMYPDSWIYRGFTRVATLIFDENKMAGTTVTSAKYMASSWYLCTDGLNLVILTRFCIATLNFDKCHICCQHAEFATKHTSFPLLLTTRWKIEPDFGSWQTPDISCSHLHRGTIT